MYFKVTLFICWTPKPLYSSRKPSETNCCTVSSTNKIAYKTLIGKFILQRIQDNGNQLVKTWSGQRAQQSEQHVSAKCWTPMQLNTAVIVTAASCCCFSGVPKNDYARYCKENLDLMHWNYKMWGWYGYTKHRQSQIRSSFCTSICDSLVQ